MQNDVSVYINIHVIKMKKIVTYEKNIKNDFFY